MNAHLVGVALEREGAIALATVSGEVDMSNAAHVLERVAAFVTPDDQALVLDLADVAFIDSAGLHAIFELHATLGERRQRLFVAVPPGGQVARTVEIIGMPEAVSVHPSRSDAIGAARDATQEARPFAPGAEP
jgi:anti-anti-sigma factor